jgi:hypothetical protein
MMEKIHSTYACLREGHPQVAFCNNSQEHYLIGEKIKDITAGSGYSFTIKLCESAPGTGNCSKPPVLDIEKAGESSSCCTYFIYISLFVPTFGTCKCFFHMIILVRFKW